MEPDTSVSGFAGHLIKDFLYSNGFHNTLRSFTEEVPEESVSVKAWTNATQRLNLAPYIFTYLGQIEFTQTLSFLEGEGIREHVDLSDWALCQEKIKSENEFREASKRSGSYVTLIEILLDFWVNAPERVRNSLLDQSIKRIQANKKKADKEKKKMKENTEKVAEHILPKEEPVSKKKKKKKVNTSQELDAVFNGEHTVSTSISRIPPANSSSGRFDGNEENMSPRTLRRKRAKLAKDKAKKEQEREGARSKASSAPIDNSAIMDALEMDSPPPPAGAVKTAEQLEYEQLKMEEVKIEEEIIMLQRRLQEKERNSVQNMQKLRNIQDWRKSHFDMGLRKDNLTTDLGMLDQKMKLLGSDLLAMKFDVQEQSRTDKIRRGSRHSAEHRDANAEPSYNMSKMLEIPLRPFGDQLQKECALCEHEFTVSNLPGRVSYKAIVDLRKTWGVKAESNPRSRFPHCYDQVKVCRFCFQFFEVPDDYRSTVLVKEEEPAPVEAAPAPEDEDDEEYTDSDA